MHHKKSSGSIITSNAAAVDDLFSDKISLSKNDAAICIGQSLGAIAARDA